VWTVSALSLKDGREPSTHLRDPVTHLGEAVAFRGHDDARFHGPRVFPPLGRLRLGRRTRGHCAALLVVVFDQ